MLPITLLRLLPLYLLPFLSLSSPLKPSKALSLISDPSRADFSIFNSTNSTIRSFLRLNPETASNFIEITCDRGDIGAPPFGSCLDVIAIMRNDFSRGPYDAPRTYGPLGPGHYDVILPKRWISRMSSTASIPNNDKESHAARC